MSEMVKQVSTMCGTVTVAQPDSCWGTWQRYYLIRPISLLLLCFVISACHPGRGNRSFCGVYIAPTSVNLSEARRSFEVQSPKPLNENGRILIYQNYLLINEPALGFHIFDNTDPENPIPLHFVNLPGNYDLVIRDDKLYADSYVDLVVLSIDSTGRVNMLGRSNGVFEGDVRVVIDRQNPVTIRQEVLKWIDKRAAEEACR